MALEVKVYREITAYQPKVIFGLSWRQLAVVAVAVPLVASVYGAAWWLGSEDLGVLLVVLVAIPAACLGWVRPMGIKFERYVGYWWRHKTDHAPYIYREELINENEEKDSRKEARRALIHDLEVG